MQILTLRISIEISIGQQSIVVCVRLREVLVEGEIQYRLTARSRELSNGRKFSPPLELDEGSRLSDDSFPRLPTRLAILSAECEHNSGR